MMTYYCNYVQIYFYYFLSVHLKEVIQNIVDTRLCIRRPEQFHHKVRFQVTLW